MVNKCNFFIGFFCNYTAHRCFNIISILTGTGYTSSNFNLWGGFGLTVMFIIMFIGGCAGSTTGGVKIFRLQLLFRAAQTQIKKQEEAKREIAKKQTITLKFGSKVCDPKILK